jgi:hypothetical protein
MSLIHFLADVSSFTTKNIKAGQGVGIFYDWSDECVLISEEYFYLVGLLFMISKSIFRVLK